MGKPRWDMYWRHHYWTTTALARAHDKSPEYIRRLCKRLGLMPVRLYRGAKLYRNEDSIKIEEYLNTPHKRGRKVGWRKPGTNLYDNFPDLKGSI